MKVRFVAKKKERRRKKDKAKNIKINDSGVSRGNFSGCDLS